MSRLYIAVLLCTFTACQNAPEPKPEAQQTQLSTENIQKGQALYKKYGCAVCHGRNGHGNGQIARTLNPRPRDFHDPKTYKFGRSIEAVSRTILKGTINERGMGMPGYPQIKEDERKTIATFIVSMQQAQ